MFRENSKAKKILSDDEIKNILINATSGVLCLQGEEYPYGVPISFYYDGNDIIFHSRFIGQKMEMIKNNQKACFTIIFQDNIKPELRTTNYQSIIAFGDIEEVKDRYKKIQDLIGFCNKYSKGFEKTNIECSNNSVDNVCVLKFKIKHISGKFQNREV